jgi:cysteine desulfurase
MKNLIYLDNNATTQMDERVLESMIPYFTSVYGNPASTHHFGKGINKIVDESRRKIADFIGCRPKELIFTSGATESINLALKGLAFHYQDKKNKIITVATEHKAVLDTCKYLEQIGYEIIILKVDRNGLVDLNDLKDKVDKYTLCVCVMLANNETGVIQPIEEISKIVHQQGSLMVCDATQAIGKLPVHVHQIWVDILAFTGHKFYGPNGIGALYIRQGLQLSTSIHGGGHERGFRSGTLNVPSIVGLAKACEIAVDEMKDYHEYISELRDYLEKNLLKVEGAFVNGNIDNRMYNVTNISFPNIDANVLIQQVKQMAISNGSACTSAVFEPSHVLKAMGLTNEEAFGAIRFSMGKYNKFEDIDQALEILSQYLPFEYKSIFRK